MWLSTVGLVNGKHRYLTAETFGFKINSNGQVMKKRQQWTIEPFPENLGPDGSISSAASISSQCQINTSCGNTNNNQQQQQQQQYPLQQQHQTTQPLDPNDPCILTFSSGGIGSSLTSIKSSSNGSSASDQDGCGEEHENVAIKSHLNKYLAVDSFGNVTCDSDEKTENARFTITICSMSQGRSKDEHIFWAFKNVERGYFLGTTDDGMICCNAKMPKSRSELWHLHLIPARGASFFALKSLGRKRYARVVDSSGGGDDNRSEQYPTRNEQQLNQDQNNIKQHQVQLDATISWGQETLFQFKYYEGGRYSLLTKDCMYLTNEGKCINWSSPDNSDSSLPPPDCLFTLEYHSGFLAFRDSFSQYLAAAGRSSILRSRSIGVSRDELFVFENAPIQISLKATFNNRWVSIKQGVDISANQTDATNKFETFQLTYHKQTQSWSIMTQECNFWTVLHNTSTVSVCKPGDYEGLTRGQFKLVWSDTDATCSLKFVDANRQERWISARKSGQLFLASGNQIQVKFIMRFQNRRLLNLRPVDGSGFVGLKGTNCKQLEANKTSPDSIAIEYSDLPSSYAGILNGVLNPPEVPSTRSCFPLETSKCLDETENNRSTINIFNVKLNSTKMGQSVLDRLNQNSGFNNINNDTNCGLKQQHEVENTDINQGKQFVDCYGIDDNNNNAEEFVNKMSGGSVEFSSTPSVASIINSFSNTKLSNRISLTSTNALVDTQLTNNRLQSVQATRTDRGNSSVLKLASNFNTATPSTTMSPTTTNITTNGTTNSQQNGEAPDTASVITSCSTASTSSSSVISSSGATNILDHSSSSVAKNTPSSSTLNDPLAQFECCYLKIISNNKYLVIGNNDSSIICDATNKACAQPWILELRSHNSIAIRASDNHAYMQLGTNGTVFLSKCEPKDASLWEF